MPKIEHILCAAMYNSEFGDHAVPARTYAYPDGVLIAGWSHADILCTLNRMGVMSGFDKWQQGFITSHKRYVDRREAAIIAIAAEQVEAKNLRNMQLYSEDLFSALNLD